MDLARGLRTLIKFAKNSILTLPQKQTKYAPTRTVLSLQACLPLPTGLRQPSWAVAIGTLQTGLGGSSAACPYAAGAAACLQSAAKDITGSYLTHDQVKATLVDTGDLIADGKINITKPRVNLGAAVPTLYNLIVPAAPTISVTSSGVTATVSWDAVAHANGYILNYAPYPFTGPDSIVKVDKRTQTSASLHLWKGAAFYVAVQAYNFIGDSSYSNIEYLIIE